MNNNLNLILEKLLQKNNISFISEELKFQITSHPSHPSLHAITGVLDHFNIENLALDIPQNEEVYTQLPNYFIVQLKNNEGEHLVFVSKQNEHVTLLYSNNKKEKILKNDFLDKWTGIVVVIDENKNEFITQIDKKYNKYIPIIVLIGIISFFIFTKANYNYYSIIQLILSIIGLYIGVLLVKHELGIYSETVEKFCIQSKKTNCEAVLNSKGATILGMFKLSDITLIYFASITFAWILYFYNNSFVLNTLTVLSILSMPVIAYSIYYQSIVVKKWCPLCLATALVLLCQAMLSFYIKPFSLPLELSGFLILSFSFLSIRIMYSNIKPLLISKLKLSKTKVEYYKFKRKFSLFNSLYGNNPILDTKIETINEIVFGNSEAKLEILVITNPLCGFCKAIHQAIDKLLNTEDLKVTVRFNINTKNREDTSYKIATALLNLYQKDKVACKKAMYEIYTDNVNINKWLKTYNSFINKSQYQILEIEKRWCINNNINFTPAVYLNNREYPKEYDLIDLSFFIDDIIEVQKEKHNNIIIKDSNAIVTE